MKGAVEQVLEQCAYYYSFDMHVCPLTEADIQRQMQYSYNLGRQGLRGNNVDMNRLQHI